MSEELKLADLEKHLGEITVSALIRRIEGVEKVAELMQRTIDVMLENDRRQEKIANLIEENRRKDQEIRDKQEEIEMLQRAVEVAGQ